MRLILQTVQKSSRVRNLRCDMYQRGIRGAITVDDNSYDCLRAAVVELKAEI